MAGEAKPGRRSREELIAWAKKPSDDALRLHLFYRGKVQTLPKWAVRGVDLRHQVFAGRGRAVSRHPGRSRVDRCFARVPKLMREAREGTYLRMRERACFA